MKKAAPSSLSQRLVFLIGGLVVFGLISVFNATSVYSQSVYGNSYKFMLLQFGWVVLGILGFKFFSSYNYKNLKKFAYILFALALVFLVILAFVSLMPCSSSFSFAPCINGANRWLFFNPPPMPTIPFLGILGFQPSEFVKLALVIYLSVQLGTKVQKKDSFFVYLLSSGLPSLLILLQPNLSTAILVFVIGSAIYFAYGPDLKKLFVFFPIVLSFAIILMMVSPYRRERVLTMFGLNGEERSEEGYHINQIAIALGSGGFWGRGFGNSMQKYQYLPEVASDSIFAIIGEELGFLGTLGVVLAFGFLIYFGFLTAYKSPDLMGKLLCVGVISWIGLQFFINAASMVGIIPLTGIPMPLISYGGSSMIFTLSSLGILVNVSRQV